MVSDACRREQVKGLSITIPFSVELKGISF